MKLLLDAGHGGVSFGHYMTKGKRSPQVPPGIYEGEFNRLVCNRVVDEYLDNVLFLNPGPINISLKQRTEYINSLVQALAPEPCLLLSVHANADGAGNWTAANGFASFVRKDSALWQSQSSKNLISNSLDFAAKLTHEFQRNTSLHNRGIKRANFSMLLVDCPAVLLECGFMTSKKDVEYLHTTSGQSMIAYSIAAAFKNVELI